ncbi:MAG: YdcF family protein [Boseongicola sp.]
MQLIRWVIAIVILSIWAALIGTALYVALYEAPEAIPSGEAIVVVSGNAAKSGGLVGETKVRLDRAIALYDDERAPRLIVSGGTVESGTTVADAMKAAAMAAGVPEDAITVEGGSHSTLQNALFTADIEDLEKSAPILLVSHRYHLPRANASFRWAGFTDVINVAADPEAGFQLTGGMLWESIKWPLNVVRAAAASAAMAGNVPRESFMKYLE